MPCITTTYAHTGAGTPVVLSVQSGGAPLAPRLLELVDQAEAALETEIERAVVIDAEGCTFDLLESFAKAKRVLITPLKPSRVPSLELTFTRGSYYRPYREHDELRIANATLVHKASGRSLAVGALLVRRAHRDIDTVLLTTGLKLGMEGQDLADLYYRRWPVQENAFKDGNAVGLSEHRGNCGPDRRQRCRGHRAGAARSPCRPRRRGTPHARQRDLRPRSRRGTACTRSSACRIGTRNSAPQRLDDAIAQGKTGGKTFARVALEHQQALVHAESAMQLALKARTALDKNRDRRAKLEERATEIAGRRRRLEPQRTIRQLDTTQDTILTATKLTALQLISFALREYLPTLPMTPQTFVQRVLSVRGRKETSPDHELIVFYENFRDPLVNDALRDACARLNLRKLKRGDRRLRFAVEPPPAIREWFD